MENLGNMRTTSIGVYNQIKNDGSLSKMRFKVFEAICRIAPCTTREAHEIMNTSTLESTRFTELRKLGVIRENGVRKCKITGRNVIEWDLTYGLPKGKISRKNLTPRGLNGSIDYLLKKMDSYGMISISKTELLNLKNKK